MPSTVTMTGPGSAVLTDDAAAAIGLQTLALQQEFLLLNGVLNQINNNLSALVDKGNLTSKAISDMQIAIASVSVAASTSNVLQASMVANQIKTNNFQVAATTQTLVATGQEVPVPPPLATQLKEEVTNSVTLNGIAQAQGAVTSFIQAQAQGIATYITETEVYRTITTWLQKQKDTILGSVFPPSPAAVAKNAKAIVGDPSLPPNLG